MRERQHIASSLLNRVLHPKTQSLQIVDMSCLEERETFVYARVDKQRHKRNILGPQESNEPLIKSETAEHSTKQIKPFKCQCRQSRYRLPAIVDTTTYDTCCKGQRGIDWTEQGMQADSPDC